MARLAQLPAPCSGGTCYCYQNHILRISDCSYTANMFRTSSAHGSLNPKLQSPSRWTGHDGFRVDHPGGPPIPVVVVRLGARRRQQTYWNLITRTYPSYRNAYLPNIPFRCFCLAPPPSSSSSLCSSSVGRPPHSPFGSFFCCDSHKYPQQVRPFLAFLTRLEEYSKVYVM